MEWMMMNISYILVKPKCNKDELYYSILALIKIQKEC